MNFLGLDVGGANLKCATLNGDGAQVPFPFWRRRESFGVELRRLVASLPGFHADGENSTLQQ